MICRWSIAFGVLLAALVCSPARAADLLVAPDGDEFVSFDVLLPGGQLRAEWRDTNGPAGMQVGPKLEINAKRQVLASSKVLEGPAVADNQWLHVDSALELTRRSGENQRV